MVELMKKEESISYLLQRSMPLTNRMGVYVGLNTKYNDVVYIGKAQDYWKRTPDSLEKKIKSLQDEECKDYGCDNITFIPCNTMKEMDEKERELIKFWKPYYNQQHNIGYFMNIGDNTTNNGEKWKKINKTARYLDSIIKIHYDYMASYKERTEESKESMRRSLKEMEDETKEYYKQRSTLNIIPLKTLRYGN